MHVSGSEISAGSLNQPLYCSCSHLRRKLARPTEGYGDYVWDMPSGCINLPGNRSRRMSLSPPWSFGVTRALPRCLRPLSLPYDERPAAAFQEIVTPARPWTAPYLAGSGDLSRNPDPPLRFIVPDSRLPFLHKVVAGRRSSFLPACADIPKTRWLVAMVPARLRRIGNILLPIPGRSSRFADG